MLQYVDEFIVGLFGVATYVLPALSVTDVGTWNEVEIETTTRFPAAGGLASATCCVVTVDDDHAPALLTSVTLCV
jgi:hypothetical protein